MQTKILNKIVYLNLKIRVIIFVTNPQGFYFFYFNYFCKLVLELC